MEKPQKITDSEKVLIIELMEVTESKIDILISFHYCGELKEDFFVEVLGDESFNNGTRARILEKLYPEDKSVAEKFRKMNKIRNTVAHNGRFKVWIDGEWHTINRKTLTFKKPEVIKYQDLFQQYKDTYNDLKLHLDQKLEGKSLNMKIVDKN